MIPFLHSVTLRFLLVSIIFFTLFSCKGPNPAPDEPDAPETVYVVNSGFLYALDATTGTKKWESTIEFQTYYIAPTVANGIVYMCSRGKLYAIDASQGTKKWDVSFVGPNGSGDVVSVPTVVNGIVYVSVYDALTNINKLSALDAVTSTIKWEFPAGTDHINSPTVANGIVYVGCGRKLFALDALTGTKKWEVDNLRGRRAYSPTNSSVVDGVIYTCFGSDVYAHDATTGIQKWTTNIGNFGSLTVENGLIFFKGQIDYKTDMDIDGQDLYVINATTGKYSKQYNFSWEGNSSPIAVNGIVYVGSGGAYSVGGTFTLHAFDALTATKKWVQNLEIPIRTSPVVAAGVVFVSGSGTGSKASTIYALDALTGAIKWETSPLRSFSYSTYTPACVVTKKGVVYHSSDSGDQQ